MSQPRTKIIMFRTSLIEKKIIEKKAQIRHMNTASFCRMVALERREKNIFSADELKAFEDLHYIRNAFVKITNLLKDKDSQFASEIMKTIKKTDSVLKIFTNDR